MTQRDESGSAIGLPALARLKRILWGLLAVWLLLALLWCGLLSLAAFYSDSDLGPDVTTAGLLRAAANASLAGVVGAVAAAIIAYLPSGLPSGDRFTPRRLERWLAALLIGLALAHAVLAIGILARGVTGWEGGIATSAPVFVTVELAVGAGTLRGLWALRPALWTVAPPALGWAFFISGIVADVALRTPTSAPGITGGLVFGVGLLAIGAVVGSIVLRRTGE